MKTGDIVRLKSGGSPMTVRKLDEDTHRADCIWFTRVPSGEWNATLHEQAFPLDLLEACTADAN